MLFHHHLLHNLWRPSLTIATISGIVLAWLYIAHAVDYRTLRAPTIPLWRDGLGVFWLSVLVASICYPPGWVPPGVGGSLAYLIVLIGGRWKRRRRSR